MCNQLINSNNVSAKGNITEADSIVFSPAIAFINEGDYKSAIGYFDEMESMLKNANVEKQQISLADLYYNKGIVLSMVPALENEALRAFCMYNRCQFTPKVKNQTKKSKKYYSFRRANEYTYSDLINNTITLVSPQKMNDPYDTLMYPWLEIHNKMYGNKNPKVSRLFSESHKHYRIRSFVAFENVDDAPFKRSVMWSHYADEHKGFCVVYSFSPSMRLGLNDSSYRVLDKITYDEKNTNLTTPDAIDGATLLFQKSEEWRYEKEHRLLVYDPAIEDDYYKLPLDSDSKIYAIIFGLRCSTDTKKIVQSILKNQEVHYMEMVSNPEDIYNMQLVDSDILV